MTQHGTRVASIKLFHPVPTEDRRAISMQLGRMKRGQSRLLRISEIGCSAASSTRDLSNSHADSDEIAVLTAGMRVEIGGLPRTQCQGL